MPRYSHISVAVPAMDELCNIPQLVAMLEAQTVQDFSLYVCVNHPDTWWNGTPFEQRVCVADTDTISLLKSVGSLDVHIIDRCTPGNGWEGKQSGVGWARKLLFEQIKKDHKSDPNELIVSLDADTYIDEDYLEKVLHTMNADPEASALAVPYYHPLSGWDDTDRAMLRYECYMRYYLIRLLKICNPYAFSALGSAMVFPLWAYQRVGGITPLQGGEDFYLMQKFCKTGRIILNTSAVVYPQGRISHRVPFGTGPAVASGLAQQREKYPFYSPEGFAQVQSTYDLLPRLYEEDLDTPMTAFMQSQMKTDDLWGPLRKNFKTRERFVNACKERLDGLRILQFLKQFPVGDAYLLGLLDECGISHNADIDFATTPIAELNQLRDHLFHLEQSLR